PALTARLRAQKDLAVPPERLDGWTLRRRREPAVIDDHAMPVAFEDPFQVLHRPQVLSEDQSLLVRGSKEARETIRLHVRRDRPGVVPQGLEPSPLRGPEERALCQPIQR